MTKYIFVIQTILCPDVSRVNGAGRHETTHVAFCLELYFSFFDGTHLQQMLLYCTLGHRN